MRLAPAAKVKFLYSMLKGCHFSFADSEGSEEFNQKRSGVHYLHKKRPPAL